MSGYSAQSPSKPLSGGGPRPVASPNGQKRDPATPSRTVRATKTPPANGLTRLPPVAPATISPRQDKAPTATKVDEDEVVRSRTPTPTRNTINSQQFNDRAKGPSATPPHDEARQSPSTNYDDDDFESSSDSDVSPSVSPARPAGSSASGTRPAAANHGTNLAEPDSGPQRSPSPVVPSSDSRHAPGTLRAQVVVDGAHDDSRERERKKKPNIQVNLATKLFVGSGTFGNVYRAVDILTNRLVAVKEIMLVEDEVKDLKKQIHAIEREIKVMQKLDHPNIVKYLGAKRTGSALYLFMEFVAGGTLSSFLSNFGPLTELQAAQFTVQILSGLDYLHSKQIAHRDLKGENLFVDTTGGLKLGDFGTSKELSTLRVTKTVAGTPYFMAPEVINCSGHGLEADIWSVGCVVIQMLTGHPPFHECDNAFAVMFQVTKGELVKRIPTSISEEAKDFIRQCVRMEPKDRPTTKQLLGHPWLHEALKQRHAHEAIASVSPPSAVEPPQNAAAGNPRANMVNHSTATTPLLTDPHQRSAIPAQPIHAQPVAPTSAVAAPAAPSSTPMTHSEHSPGSVERLRSKMPSKVNDSPPPPPSQQAPIVAQSNQRSPPPTPPTKESIGARKTSSSKVAKPTNITAVGTSTLPAVATPSRKSPPPVTTMAK